MVPVSGFFDIRDDSAFFAVVSNALNSFLSTKTKKPEDLLLLILGLAHLREWIAPKYERGAAPRNSAERFAAILYENPNYQTVLLLANHAKHQRRGALPETQSMTFVDTIDERDIPIDSWPDFDQGPASSYLYGQRNLEDLFKEVALLYREQWFSLPIDQRLA